jgi:hypothetical protein
MKVILRIVQVIRLISTVFPTISIRMDQESFRIILSSFWLLTSRLRFYLHNSCQGKKRSATSGGRKVWIVVVREKSISKSPLEITICYEMKPLADRCNYRWNERLWLLYRIHLNLSFSDNHCVWNHVQYSFDWFKHQLYGIRRWNRLLVWNYRDLSYNNSVVSKIWGRFWSCLTYFMETNYI